MAVKKQYEINWRKSDYLSLGRAVSQFNKKINQLNAEEKRAYLPETITYANVKENIKTRSELNRVINRLRRFTKEGAEDLYITEAGEQITKWEKREIGYLKRTAVTRLKKELKELQTPLSTGFSRVQMGSERAREIEAQLKSLQNFEVKSGAAFERLKRRIEFLGTSDYTLKMSYVFRKNFMDQLNNLRKNSSEFQKVYDYFNNIKNPIEFYNITQKSQALEDFFTWYQQPENYASFATKEDLANYILKEYDLL